MDIAFFIARLIVGLGIAAHGSQKLFGSFGGPGLKGFIGASQAMGFRPAALFGTLAGLGELIAGILIVFGILGPVGPALLILVMIVAVGSVHWKNGYFATNGGYELNAALIAAALLFAFGGFGGWSLDRAWNLTLLAGDQATWITIGVAVVLALLSLATRKQAPSA